MFERDSARATTIRDLTPPEPDSAPDNSNWAAGSEAGATQISNHRFIRGWYWRVLAVAAEVGVAFFLRELVAHKQPDFAPFITFYPAVLLACLLDGIWAGIAVTVLAALVADIWIFAPMGTLRVSDPYDILSLGIFMTFGISLSIVVELYHRNREKLASYLVGQAISQERTEREA